MNAYVTGFAAREELTLSRAEAYIHQHRFERPTLVIDTQAVARQYSALAQGLGRAHIHFAVKANPAPGILSTLAALGSNFDAASRAEIQMCLDAGATADRISFGNTIKRVSDIAWAHAQGIDLFAADAEEELHKIAAHAPGARVYIRIIVDACEADWPLSRKFGCARDKALELIALAKTLDLRPVGLSFHVGSQTRRASMWAPVLDQVAAVWHAAQAEGHEFELLNIGGGFPAFYGQEIDAPMNYAAEVMAQVTERFGDVPHIMAEPGRGLVAEAGAIAAEVLLVSKKTDSDLHRWVYLDIGKFSGLAETMDEAIRYQFMTSRDHEPTGPCVLAGPSCDSADVLYEKQPVQLPLGLQSGDRIVIRCCGAYTSTYASVGFNGFPPLDVVAI
ncbi:type III PLP-dependent enzyme [Tropicibacter naphthalenivorans]|uniref:ornithine decarboxylase n=1 Tax=Tropicibacter naphthalenivorans TaxID=441103 RepID=A0A0P1GV59_9RHOB|nr:type III PLP-dependent enzyme [Tropicibacter naphthalenivorans]CUH77962.1 Lysine/ornithine decarboxylase [Tropicibacter naphthalenivorans]SMC94827.1 ornithine decarboxylase [Tropicibacter naphthalenivorans]